MLVMHVLRVSVCMKICRNKKKKSWNVHNSRLIAFPHLVCMCIWSCFHLLCSLSLDSTEYGTISKMYALIVKIVRSNSCRQAQSNILRKWKTQCTCGWDICMRFRFMDLCIYFSSLCVRLAIGIKLLEFRMGIETICIFTAAERTFGAISFFCFTLSASRSLCSLTLYGACSRCFWPENHLGNCFNDRAVALNI